MVNGNVNERPLSAPDVGREKRQTLGREYTATCLTSGWPGLEYVAVLVDVVCERDDAAILPVCFVWIQAQIWTADIFDLRLPTRRN